MKKIDPSQIYNWKDVRWVIQKLLERIEKLEKHQKRLTRTKQKTTTKESQ